MDILLEKSLINCHCYGMDSLVLKDGPNMIRMFIARPEHELWRNGLIGMPHPAGGKVELLKDFSIALHRHHCDVTLQPIMGEVFNVAPTPQRDGLWTSAVSVKSYKYHSPILVGENARFVPLDNLEITLSLSAERIDRPKFMQAGELHTVFVPRNQSAAWYVWEGQEAKDRNNIVYSNAQLENFDFSKIDLPMTEDRLQEDLHLIGVRSAR